MHREIPKRVNESRKTLTTYGELRIAKDYATRTSYIDISKNHHLPKHIPIHE